jgi:hypothetical protein
VVVVVWLWEVVDWIWVKMCIAHGILHIHFSPRRAPSRGRLLVLKRSHRAIYHPWSWLLSNTPATAHVGKLVGLLTSYKLPSWTKFWPTFDVAFMHWAGLRWVIKTAN